MLQTILFCLIGMLTLIGGIRNSCLGFSGTAKGDPKQKYKRRIRALLYYAIAFYSIATILIWAIEESSKTPPLIVFCSILLRSFTAPGIIAQVTMVLSWFVEIFLTALLLIYFLKKLNISI